MEAITTEKELAVAVLAVISALATAVAGVVALGVAGRIFSRRDATSAVMIAVVASAEGALNKFRAYKIEKK